MWSTTVFMSNRSIMRPFDEIRIDIRRQLIAEENNRDKSEPPVTYSNGETMRQILARSNTL